MELNQLLQNLLNTSGKADTQALPTGVLKQLTRVVDADAAKVLMQVLQRAAGNAPVTQMPASTTTADVPTAARLPVLPVTITLTPANAALQRPPQVLLNLDLNGKTLTLPIAIDRPQQQQLQQLPPANQNQPLLLLVKAVLPTARGATTSQSSAQPVVQNPLPTTPPAATGAGAQPSSQSQALLQVQLVSPKAPQQPVTLSLPLTQLPRPVAAALLNTATSVTSPSSPPTVATAAPAPTPVSQAPAPQGLMLKQASQITPQQFQQALQQLLRSLPAPPQPSMPTAAPAPASPEQALTRLLRVAVQQLPPPEAMQQPQQLKQWVNDWFAAKPVAAQAQQQLGGLGKMLMMLLGMTLQKAPTPSATGAAASALQQHNANHLTQALLDEILRPAAQRPNEPQFTGEVRDRINQLLQQLPQTQLQRLMQLFTAVLNGAQTSQARLAETSTSSPEYFVLLPASAQQQQQQHELLIRREQQPPKDGEPGRTLWLFTLRFELQQYGPLLVKGRYHPAGTRVDFYTESDHAQRSMEKHIEKLAERFSSLEVQGIQLAVQKGKVPDTLATQQSGIIRVTV